MITKNIPEVLIEEGDVTINTITTTIEIGTILMKTPIVQIVWTTPAVTVTMIPITAVITTPMKAVSKVDHISEKSTGGATGTTDPRTVHSQVGWVEQTEYVYSWFFWQSGNTQILYYYCCLVCLSQQSHFGLLFLKEKQNAKLSHNFLSISCAFTESVRWLYFKKDSLKKKKKKKKCVRGQSILNFLSWWLGIPAKVRREFHFIRKITCTNYYIIISINTIIIITATPNIVIN